MSGNAVPSTESCKSGALVYAVSISLSHALPALAMFQSLCDELYNTAGLFDLLLGVLGEVARAHEEGNVGKTTLAEDLGVAQRQEVEDGSSVLGTAGDVLFALLEGNEGPELLLLVSYADYETIAEHVVPCRG